MTVIENQFPVSVGEDILGAMDAVNAEIGRVLGHNTVAVETDENGLQRKIHDALRSHDFVNSLRTLDRHLVVALSQLWKAEREDVLKLLEDPLSTETRNTRRNLGVLTVLAALVGLAGKASGHPARLRHGGVPRLGVPVGPSVRHRVRVRRLPPVLARRPRAAEDSQRGRPR